jgi:hypothetical protein
LNPTGATSPNNGPEEGGQPNGANAPSAAVRTLDSRAALLQVYGLYLVATIILTWPVTLRIGTDLPGGGPGDPQIWVWNIWWLKFSLFRLHQNPLWCSWIAWPFGASLALHAHTFVYSAVAILLSPFGVNVAASVTLLFLNSFALMGLGTYLWCREFGAGRRGAFVGGFVATFCIYRFARGLCHYNLMATEFLPFFWLFLKRGIENGQWRAYFGAGIFLLLAFWQDQQIFVFAVMFGACYLVAAFLGDPGRLIRRCTWKGVAVLAAVFFLGSLPFWVAAVPLMMRGEYAVRDGAPIMASDTLSFFVPWTHHWLFGRWTKDVYALFRYTEIESDYVGYVALALAVIGFRQARAQKRRIGWLAVTAVVFLVLSFGESLEVAGQTTFPAFGDRYSVILPGKIVGYIPGLRQLRAFSRLVFLTVFALAVPVALAADWLEQRARRPRTKRWLVPTLLAAIALEVAPLPYMTHPCLIPWYAPYGFLERIRNDPELTTVFLVPPTICQPQEQYFQMFHEKPIYGGLLSRTPAYLTERYRTMPAIGNFFWERQDKLDEKEAEEALTPEFVERFIEFHNIKYLILAPAPKLRLISRLIETRFPIARIRYEKQYLLCELERPPAGRPLSADLSQPWGFLYLGRGFWPPQEEIGSWAVRREAELMLPIRGKNWKAITVEMTPFVSDKVGTQTTEVFLNDRRMGGLSLERRFVTYQFAIPDGALDDRPCSTLRFRFGFCVVPVEIGYSKDRRTLAAVVRRVHVLAEPRDDLPVVDQSAAQK